MPRKNQYFGGIIGASPFVEAGVTGQFMLIGGGGGGSGPAAPGYPGGGGAGGVVYGSSFSFSTGSYVIVVGDGGASAGYETYGNPGADTTGFGFTAKGGGGGVGGGTTYGSDEKNGGSGAGWEGASTQDTYSGTTNVSGYGNDGGPLVGTNLTGGGGGGAGEAGNTDGDGRGGKGLTNSFLDDIQYGQQSGINYYVAGGGAGGKYGGTQAAGGLGGGGAGAVGGTSSGAWVDATAGTTGYGAGGGGGNRRSTTNYREGKAGGKGVVLVWLPKSYSLGSDYTGSATTSAKTVGGVAGTLITFTTSGTWSPTL